jgi:hypothetical protein
MDSQRGVAAGCSTAAPNPQLPLVDAEIGLARWLLLAAVLRSKPQQAVPPQAAWKTDALVRD